MIHFDPTVSLGSLMSIVGIIVGFWTIAGRIAVLEFKINELWEKRDKE